MARTAELDNRVTRLEDYVGGPTTNDALSLTVQVCRLVETMETIVARFDALEAKVEERLGTTTADVEQLSNSVDDLKNDTGILKRFATDPSVGMAVNHMAAPRIKVPEPNAFGGARCAKELENFLWDMEQYFAAAHVSEREKVGVAGMYLKGDAKLWWRTRLSHTSAGRVETWDAMKKELKSQFLPSNTGWIARDALRKLKHTGTIREYVKEFSSLLLEVTDMSEEDRLFNFMAGLQYWAQAEVRRLGVKTVAQAIAAADGLADFRTSHGPSEERTLSKRDKKARNGNVGGFERRNATEVSGFERRNATETRAEKTHRVESSGNLRGSHNTGCYICDGAHFARDCPERRTERVNAVTTSGNEARTERETQVRVNPLQLLSAITMQPASTPQAKELADVREIVPTKPKTLPRRRTINRGKKLRRGPGPQTQAPSAKPQAEMGKARKQTGGTGEGQTKPSRTLRGAATLSQEKVKGAPRSCRRRQRRRAKRRINEGNARTTSKDGRVRPKTETGRRSKEWRVKAKKEVAKCESSKDHEAHQEAVEQKAEVEVRSCTRCQADKSGRDAKAGETRPKPIAEEPWEMVSENFLMVKNVASALFKLLRNEEFSCSKLWTDEREGRSRNRTSRRGRRRLQEGEVCHTLFCRSRR